VEALGKVQATTGHAVLVATLTTPPSAGGRELTTLPEAVQWLEVRADLVGDLPPDWLRSHFPGHLLYTLRSRVEGGAGTDSRQERRARLLEAAPHYDLIDLEGERDLCSDMLEAIPPHRRLLSWHGPATDARGLMERCAELSTVAARLYRLVPRAEQPGDALAPLACLQAMGRADTLAYASGPTGFWTRLVAPYLGAPIVFAVAQQARGDGGEPSASQLIEDYGLPVLPPLSDLFGIVGNPVLHSLSPRLHNAAYHALGYPALYVPFHAASFVDFWRQVVEAGRLESVGLRLRGLTVVSPHKEVAAEVAGACSAIVRRVGSSNALIRANGVWRADTTDAEGVLWLLRERGIEVEGKRVAVVGCGGSGRAMAAALAQAGAAVTLVNRGRARGQRAMQQLGLPFVSLSDFTVQGFSVVLHATPVGRDDGALPFGLDGLDEDATVIDLVYGAAPTPLGTQAQALGRVAIDGRAMLLAQARCQFRLMTGQEMPLDLAREILGCGAELADAVPVGS
jgi:3-dehydroquinate dehydratase/shikimate dehydrogenase